MKGPFVVMRREKYEAMVHKLEVGEKASRDLAKLQRRFAADILYGATVPEDPRAASERAFAAVNGYLPHSIDLSEGE